MSGARHELSHTRRGRISLPVRRRNDRNLCSNRGSRTTIWPSIEGCDQARDRGRRHFVGPGAWPADCVRKIRPTTTPRTEMRTSVARVLLLDRVMAHYGPETARARALLRQAGEGTARPWLGRRRQCTKPPRTSQSDNTGIEPVQDIMRGLSPPPMRSAGCSRGRWRSVARSRKPTGCFWKPGAKVCPGLC